MGLPSYTANRPTDCLIFLADTDILHVNFAGTPLIILDSYEAVNELLDKRSATFSDRLVLPLPSATRHLFDKSLSLSTRPQYTMQSELMGLDFNFAFMRYGQYVRLQFLIALADLL